MDFDKILEIKNRVSDLLELARGHEFQIGYAQDDGCPACLQEATEAYNNAKKELVIECHKLVAEIEKC